MAVRGSSTLTERELLAEYPFLPGADRLLEELAPSLRELIDGPVYQRAQELGRARVRAAADDPAGTPGLAELARASAEERYLSFLYARLLVGAATTAAARRRWAVAEAKRSGGRLRRAPVEELLTVAGRLGFRLEPDGDRVRLPLPEYVKLATPIREAEFRLARQPVRNGEVTISVDRAGRLVQEAIRLQLSPPLPMADELVGRLREREAEFLDDLAERMPIPSSRPGAGEFVLDHRFFPPCIRAMRRKLQDGENLSHSGRFALAAFLHKAGANFETIVDAYRGAPDFDEGITSYQVEHITRRDEGRGYEPPECETLRSHGLCFRDGDPAAKEAADRSPDGLCFDPRLKHPLQYYRWKGGPAVERAPRSVATRPSAAGPTEDGSKRATRGPPP